MIEPIQSTHVRYRSGYRYQTDEAYTHLLDWYDGPALCCPFVTLRSLYIWRHNGRIRRVYREDLDGDHPDDTAVLGVLHIDRGYAWDGPSGPAIHTANFMRGSLVHDALYQLMREGHLAASRYRDDADKELKLTCLEDGMSSLRAWWVYHGVRLGGGPSTRGDGGKHLRFAP